MKKVIIALLCLTVSSGALFAQAPAGQGAHTPPPPVGAPAAAAPQAPDPNAGKFKFKEEIHTFHDVPEGPLAEYDFEFTNVGKSPITISDCHGSCGCTVPSWPHEPILPGATNKIHVTYNTNSRPGMIDKSVTVNSDAQQKPMMLYIKGNVIPKPKEEAKPVDTKAPAKQ
jgi:hypothetical protein